MIESPHEIALIIVTPYWGLDVMELGCHEATAVKGWAMIQGGTKIHLYNLDVTTRPASILQLGIYTHPHHYPMDRKHVLTTMPPCQLTIVFSSQLIKRPFEMTEMVGAAHLHGTLAVCGTAIKRPRPRAPIASTIFGPA